MEHTLLVNNVRQEFSLGRTQSLSFRKEQLQRLYDFLDDNRDVITSAVKEDLNKPWFETAVVEIDFLLNEIRGTLHSLDDWAKPKKVGKSIPTLFDKAFVQKEPFGVVLIIGAWNYPMQLLLGPLIGAIAAGKTIYFENSLQLKLFFFVGNAAIIKPSEVAYASAKLISELLPKYLDPKLYRVVLGDAQETQSLLKIKFDYIFFTGSHSIGAQVQQEAAKHLTPTTLELGGKSPCYVDESLEDGSPLLFACRRIIWGKMMNAGQTCIAPDYVLCTQSTQKRLVKVLAAVVEEFFTSNPQESPDFGRIVNERHFDRLNKLLQSTSGKVALGGQTDKSKLYISPTIILDVSPQDPIMNEEIFGPLFPIVTIDSDLTADAASKAIEFINERPKPLAVYVFGTDDIVERFTRSTSSGALCANDVVLHCSLDTLPFGGVGQSGHGSYHGQYSFDTFSHEKAGKLKHFGVCLIVTSNFDCSFGQRLQSCS